MDAVERSSSRRERVDWREGDKRFGCLFPLFLGGAFACF
jgi:hypothetical protein